MKTFLVVSASTFLWIAALPFVANADESGHPPYIVRGNNHILIGVSLDEIAVRAALPAGIEPTEGVTGGYNVYRSGGGYNTPAFTRALSTASTSFFGLVPYGWRYRIVDPVASGSLG